MSGDINLSTAVSINKAKIKIKTTKLKSLIAHKTHKTSIMIVYNGFFSEAHALILELQLTADGLNYRHKRLKTIRNAGIHYMHILLIAPKRQWLTTKRHRPRQRSIPEKNTLTKLASLTNFTAVPKNLKTTLCLNKFESVVYKLIPPVTSFIIESRGTRTIYCMDRLVLPHKPNLSKPVVTKTIIMSKIAAKGYLTMINIYFLFFVDNFESGNSKRRLSSPEETNSSSSKKAATSNDSINDLVTEVGRLYTHKETESLMSDELDRESSKSLCDIIPIGDLIETPLMEDDSEENLTLARDGKGKSLIARFGSNRSLTIELKVEQTSDDLVKWIDSINQAFAKVNATLREKKRVFRELETLLHTTTNQSTEERKIFQLFNNHQVESNSSNSGGESKTTRIVRFIVKSLRKGNFELEATRSD